MDDVAEGLLRLGASRASPGAVINLATGTLTSVRQFAEKAAFQLGISEELCESRPLAQGVADGLAHRAFGIVTAMLVVANVKARGQNRYEVQQSQVDRSLATRLMPWTGTVGRRSAIS